MPREMSAKEYVDRYVKGTAEKPSKKLPRVTTPVEKDFSKRWVMFNRLIGRLAWFYDIPDTYLAAENSRFSSERPFDGIAVVLGEPCGIEFKVLKSETLKLATLFKLRRIVGHSNTLVPKHKTRNLRQLCELYKFSAHSLFVVKLSNVSATISVASLVLATEVDTSLGYRNIASKMSESPIVHCKFTPDNSPAWIRWEKI